MDRPMGTIYSHGLSHGSSYEHVHDMGLPMERLTGRPAVRPRQTME